MIAPQKQSEVVFEYCSPKFRVLYEAPKGIKFFVFPGGRGGGKDHSLARYVLDMMSTFKCRILICREFQSSIRQSNHRVLKDVIIKHELGDLFQVTDYEIRCEKTGSNIIFAGLHHNLDNIRSIEGVDICIVNEAQSVSSDSLDTLIPTVIRNKNARIIYSLNPRFKTDAVWAEFIEPIRKDTIVTKVNLCDNRFADLGLLEISEQLKKSDFDRWRWIYGGECLGEEEMSLISQLLVHESRIRKIVRDESLKISAGLDVAGMGKDKTVLIRRRGTEILSIHTLDKGDTNIQVDWVKSIYIEYKWDLIVIDGTGSRGVADLIDAWGSANRTFETFVWIASRKPRNSVKYVNARTEAWGIMRDWIRECGVLTDHREWEELPRILFKYVSKEQIALELKSKLSKSPDFGDALSLSLWYQDEQKENIYQSYDTYKFGTFSG